MGCRRSKAACAQAMSEGVHSSDVIITILYAAPRPGTGGQHPHAGCADAPPRTGRRLRQIRSTQERMSMERTEVLDMMGEAKPFPA